ncbi:PucR family transcriptional regulator [Pseudonocardia sp.]|uniref:PucR family transcriptional regulator n=1 Tax=Pseudonocardia sp. TaxID=60912 RepID=UPI003D0A5B42
MNTALRRVVPAAAPRPGDRPAVGLGRLLAATAPDTVRIVRAPDGLDVEVRGVAVWDLATPAAEAVAAGDLVLVTATGAAADPMRLRRAAAQAAARGAAGLVLRPRAAHPDWVPAAELAVLTAGPRRAWPAVRRELLAAHALQGAPLPDGGDLHALADDVAAAFGATVLVTGNRLEVLAHSLHDGEPHEPTREWILRRVPPAAAPVAVRALAAAAGVVEVRGPDGRDWQAVAVRAGGETLGTLWCAGSVAGSTEAHGHEVLARAARRAAAWLARTAAPQPRSRLGTDLLHAALAGHGWPDELVELVAGPDGGPPRLLVFGAGPRAAAGAATDRLERLLALQLGPAVPRLVTARAGGRIYALAPDSARLVEAVGDVVERARRRGHPELRCVVGDPAGRAELALHRAEIDRLLDVLAGEPGPAVAEVADHRSRSVLAELAGTAAERPRLLRGPVQRLREIDAADGTRYLETLRAYFDARQDVMRAARSLHLHRNTLRYRLGRIRALAGLDLDDHADRLVAELQLRLHDLVGTARTEGKAS